VPRNQEVIRQWRVLHALESSRHGIALDTLAKELEVTTRTIRRDLAALQEAGFPLYDDRADGRRIWRLVEGYKHRVTQTFTLSELAALYFGKNLMSFLGGSPFGEDLDSAFAKIREALPARALPYLSRIQDLFAVRPEPWKDYSKKKDVIAGLIDATLHQRRARLEYYSLSSRRTKGYVIDPYRVVYHHGGLYVYARVAEYEEVRTFAVERIKRFELLEQSFEIPKDFDLGEYARGAFGITGGRPEHVELHFDAPAADYVRERVWHESQSLEERPDGSVVLRMSVAPGPELQTWVKGFLPHVRVIAPRSLREAVARDLDAARARF
jgi:predicted DNA-binding transcriptional regulator YafY